MIHQEQIQIQNQDPNPNPNPNQHQNQRPENQIVNLCEAQDPRDRGTVSIAEFRAILRVVFPDITDGELRHAMREVSVNGSGYIEYRTAIADLDL